MCAWPNFNSISKYLVGTLHKYSHASLKDGDYSEKKNAMLLYEQLRTYTGFLSPLMWTGDNYTDSMLVITTQLTK